MEPNLKNRRFRSPERVLALLIGLFGLFSPASAQTFVYRIDPAPVMTTGRAPTGGFPTAYVVPNATIKLCSDSLCATPANSYTDSTGNTQCPLLSPVTLPGTSVCTPTAGTQGQFGFWVQPGTYYYTVTTVTGTFGPYPVSSPTVGTLGGPGTLSVNNAGGFSVITNVQDCSHFSGASAGAKIIACIAGLPAAGGVADARGLPGAQSIPSTITISGNITVLLGSATYSCAANPCFSLTGNGPGVIGLGYGSQITATTTGANVINVPSATNAFVSNLHLYGNSTSSTGTDGISVYVTSSASVTISNIYAEQFGSGGVVMTNTNDSKVLASTFTNAVAFSGNGNDACVDIRDSSARNLVEGNSCTADKSTGISVRTITSGTTSLNNKISGNVVTQKEVYGILSYRTNLADTMDGNTIVDNTVRDIQGSLTNTFTGVKDFGACIYIQGDEDFVVDSNNLTNCNVQTTGDNEAPGAIGVQTTTAGTITGNTINTPYWYGITIRDPNQIGRGSGSGDSFVPTGGVVVTGNHVYATSSTTKGLFHVLDHHNVTMVGNFGYGGTAQGVIVRVDGVTYTYLRNIRINGNQMKATGDIAFTVNDVRYSSVSGNTASSPTGSGFAFNVGQYNQYNSNVVNSSAASGILIQGSQTNCQALGNNATANLVGMNVQSACWLGDDNLVTGNTTNWSGTYQLIRAMTGATPDVTAAKRLNKTDNTNVTNFTNGIIGQTLVLYLNAACAPCITHTAGQLVLADGLNFNAVGGEVLTFQMFFSGVWTETSRLHPPLTGVTAAIGGGALTAGQCSVDTVVVTGWASANSVGARPVVTVTSNTDPVDGSGNRPFYYGRLTNSATGQVTVYVCAPVNMTPTASTYTVSVAP